MLIERYEVSVSCATNFHTEKKEEEENSKHKQTNSFKSGKMERMECRVNVISAFGAIGVCIENASTYRDNCRNVIQKSTYAIKQWQCE